MEKGPMNSAQSVCATVNLYQCFSWNPLISFSRYDTGS